MKTFTQFINEGDSTNINNEKEFREFAEKKFKDIFNDKLDKERMKTTIDGFLKSNKKLVDNDDWDKLVGMFKNAF